MSNPQPEPSMEEILASIRRIISEDGDEEESSASAESPARKEPAPEPLSKTDIFKKQEEPAKQAEKPQAPVEQVRSEPKKHTEDIEMVKQNVAEAMQDDTDDAILAETTAAAASKAFQDLSQSVRVSRSEGGRTLEDIVTDMLRPMVKEWLDANLPAIVEEKVEEEVQRVARRRR